MEESLTLREMETRFDSEWLLVADPVTDSNSRLLSGTVVFHSKSRDEVDRRDGELGLRAAAIVFTGSIPENAAVVL